MYFCVNKSLENIKFDLHVKAVNQNSNESNVFVTDKLLSQLICQNNNFKALSAYLKDYT